MSDFLNNDAIALILSKPAVGESGRHADICARSLQLRANGMSDEHIFIEIVKLYPIGSGVHRKITESEIRTAIRGLYGKTLTPTPTRRTHRQNYAVERAPLTVKSYEHDGSLESLPSDEIGMSYSEFFKDLLGFHDDEQAWLATMEQKVGGKEDGKFYFKQWKEGTPVHALIELDDCSGDGLNSHGSYFAVNPFKSDAQKRTQENVSRFLYTMIEHDNISREEQLAIYTRTGIPCIALIDSGNASLHAIVKIDAQNLEEYQARVKTLRDYLGLGFDKTQDAARFMRLPNAVRSDDKVTNSRQRLLAINVGAASWDEFEATLDHYDGLPEIQSPKEFLSKRMELDPYLVEGLFRENSKMNLTSKSKKGKTWFLLQQALCIGSGKPWMGRETKPSPVLFVNLELKPNTMNNRVFDVCEAIGIDPATGHNVDFWNLRGSSADIAVMVERILRRVQQRKYKLVYLDLAYKCLGWRDENKAGDITDFQNNIERVATEAGAAIIVTGHTPKGDLSGRAANDLQSGSGVWSRDPDVVASFLDCTDEAIVKEHGEECITIQFSGMREDKMPDPIAAKWKFPIFQLLNGLVPQKAAKRKGRTAQIKPWDLAKFFKDDERLAHKEIKERAAKEDIKSGSFQKRLSASVESGCLKHDPAAGVYWVGYPRLEEVKRLNSNEAIITL